MFYFGLGGLALADILFLYIVIHSILLSLFL